jgi:glycosyltransferase involved in cell wall biosynthesis
VFVPPSPTPHPIAAPRIAVFTDTIADVNGVARFVEALAVHEPAAIHVISSARNIASDHRNVHIARPIVCRAMPGYANLDLVIPSPAAIARYADALAPNVVHVSTPGPVGLIGRRFALRRGLPLVGTFHTDLPAYIDRLFNDHLLTRAGERLLRWFYSSFDLVLARSLASMPSLARAGIESHRIALLSPGIDTHAFHPRHRGASNAVWQSIPGARADALKVLYVGRVSFEKHLSMLARLWPRVRAECDRRRHDVQLIITGDGPYLPAMRRELATDDVCFAGFRHGDELAALYASSDLFVFPSTTDTLGQAVMEAQSSGLPAIVSDRGGPSQIVQHERTGLILCISSDEPWINAIVRLIARPSERIAMGQAARAHLAPMTIRASIDCFVAIHAELLAAKTQPGHALARGPARR